MERSPRADVAPAGSEGHHHGIRGLLHHRVVDRVSRARGESLGRHAGEIEIGTRRAECGFARARNLGRETRELGEVAAGAEHEHAAVPVVLAGAHELQRPFGVRLLDEARDAAQRTALRAALDVAVTGLGRGGHDAEGDQLPLTGRGEREAHGALESRHVLDHVIGRQNQQHRILGVRRQTLHCRVRGERNGGCGVASDGLEHDGLGLDLELPELFGDQESVCVVAHHDRRRGVQALEAQRRLLQHGARTDQGEELFRVELARQRPEPGAGAARQNHGYEHRFEP